VKRQGLEDYLESVDTETVDVVVLMDVLEHLTRQELFDILDQVFRVLRPDGRCIASMPNAEGLFGMRVRYGDLTHETAFTPRSANQAFSSVGFRTVQCSEVRPVRHGLVSTVRWLLWHLGTLPSRVLLAAETGEVSFILSQTMYAVALK
jgi:hypothetical protein